MRQWVLLLLLMPHPSCGYGIYQLAKQIQDAAQDDGGDQPASTTPAIEATKTYAIALGGVAPGRDELVLSGVSGQTLTFSASSTIVGLLPRPTFASFAAGLGAQIVPQQVGTATIRYQIDGAEQPETFAVTVPPQALIQVLIGEARGLLKAEATIKDGIVQLDSTSNTGNAVAAVIRNRIALINAEKDPSLFAADPLAYYLGPPASAYTAVIEAVHNGIYQFSPVAPTDPNYDEYTHAEARSFLAATDHLAYDQAVLTAAAMFDQRTDDPTGGAFAFRSPTAEEATCLTQALAEKPAEIPEECGPGDDNFPALAPVQILIHPSVGKQSDGRPAFVLYRKRTSGALAVTDVP